MKRHEALAPLSREHHDGLILAQLLKKNAPPYRGLPTDLPGKLGYAREVFCDILDKHFIQEEKVLHAISGKHQAIDEMTKEIIAEHNDLRKMFKKLGMYGRLEEDLDALGHALEAHIRKEERELFPLIQEHASIADMRFIHQITAGS